MRVFLLIYFTFCIVADPWIDGRTFEFDSHVISQAPDEADVPLEVTGNEKPTVLVYNHESQHHGNCPESCPDHTCHLGHCGLLIGSQIPPTPPTPNELFTEYKPSAPSGPVFTLRRPPKTSV